MPSIGAATAIIVAQRIDAAVKTNFDEKTRKDAYKFLALSSRGGEVVSIILIAVIGTMLTIALATNENAFLTTITGSISLLALCWTIWRRKKARRDLDVLIASNPGYWLPIRSKLEQIILGAGKFEDGLPPRQATHIVR